MTQADRFRDTCSPRTAESPRRGFFHSVIWAIEQSDGVWRLGDIISSMIT
jgi:hypothetical protein